MKKLIFVILLFLMSTSAFAIVKQGSTYFVGNVGIGSSNPAQPLDVVGTIRANSLIPIGDSVGIGTSGILFSAPDGKIGQTFNGQSESFNAFYNGRYESSIGTEANPTTLAGPLLKLSRNDSMKTASCNGNKNDNECNSVVNIQALGDVNATVETAGIETDAANSSTTTGVDAIGILSKASIYDSGVGKGTGAYLEGNRESSAGSVLGAEIRAQEGSGNNCLYSTSSLTTQSCTGLYVDDSSFGQGIELSSAIQIGQSDATASWRTALTIESGIMNSSNGIDIDDWASDTIGLNIRGTHSTGAIIIAPGDGNVGIGSATPGTALDVQGSIRTTGFLISTGTAGAVLCLTSGRQTGHCSASAACTSTCTCTCVAN